nr:reverse transcriptase domain-containing protein [Tanacetum cinerariifolium]
MANPDDEPMWTANCVVALTPGQIITIPETASEFVIKENHLILIKRNQFDYRIKMILTSMYTNFLRELRAFSKHDHETLTGAWLRMEYLLRNCHGHGLTKGNIFKIFYYGLNETTQEALNATLEAFLSTNPKSSLLTSRRQSLKLDWAKNQKPKTPIRKTLAIIDEGSSNSDTDKIMARMEAMTMTIDAQYKEMKSFTDCNHCGGNHLTADCNDDDTPMSREEEAKFTQTFRRTHFYNDYHDRDSNRDSWHSSGRNDYNQNYC